MTEAAIRIEALTSVGHINLRGNPRNEVFLETTESVLDQKLPLVANTVTEGEYTVYWLGPDEFQITCPIGSVTNLCERLAIALSGVHFAVNDLSGGQVALELQGEAVPLVLAKGCTLDLHQRVFPVGACAQSGLGKANVLIVNRRKPGQYDVMVRRSFSDYLIKWLLNAADEYGVQITGQ